MRSITNLEHSEGRLLQGDKPHSRESKSKPSSAEKWTAKKGEVEEEEEEEEGGGEGRMTGRDLYRLIGIGKSGLSRIMLGMCEWWPWWGILLFSELVVVLR